MSELHIEKRSLAEIFAELPDEDRQAILDGMSPEEQEALQYDADFWLRPAQKIGEEGDWHITALIAGRGFGKGIHLSTPVPTPTGWTTMGEIKTGDQVFDENGEPCEVLKAHDPYTPDKLYKLTFSDGTTIIADGDHLWTTWTHADRKSYNRRNEYNNADESVGLPEDWPTWTKHTRWGKPTGIGPKTRTTQEIVDTFRYGKRGDLNHSIPVTKPVQYPERDLPVDPYVFGAWLGDGSSGCGTICSHEDEIDWLAQMFEDRGYGPTKAPTRQRDSKCFTFTATGLHTALSKQGILHNKHIPKEYLVGSEQQRRDLLAGLLDTDGFTDPRTNYIEFCAKRREHADAVMELARSLGQKPKMYIGRATLNGVDHGEKYRVQWRPTENFFYMPRKVAAFVPMGAQASRNMHRMIVNYEELPVETVRCLTVDSKNRLFLVGEGYQITHNTLAMSYWVQGLAVKHPGCRIGIGGRTSGDVRRILVEGESGILAISDPANRPEFKQQKAALYWPNGSMAELHSSEAPDAARGVQYHYTVGDEFAAWKTNTDSSGATLYSNLIAATRLGKHPRLLLATTPKRTAVMKDLIDRSKDPEQNVRIVTGTTFDNTTLSKAYLLDLKRQYGNTDLAKQELEGKMLDDAEGVVFTTSMIEDSRDFSDISTPPLRVIAVDPTVAGDPKNSDECGIMAMGASNHADISKRQVYLLQDYSLRASPEVWVREVVRAAKEHNTRYVVVEKNQGGDLLRLLIQAQDPTLKIFLVTATKGKLKRAEPVAVAMSQHRVHLCDEFPDLEQQLLFYDPDNSDYSPDRMDAFVWGCIALIIDPPQGLRIGHYRASSAVGRKLPTGIGTGRSRAVSTSRNGRGLTGSSSRNGSSLGFR